jgi:DNA segregation ATPase FtsK/SpoIIIE, S-DNA-T family
MGIKNYLYRVKMKDKLKNCFRAADLYKTVKVGDRTVYIYPKIHSVTRKEDENLTVIVFTLFNGLDPKEVKKKLYAFQQVFGKSIDLKGDTKQYKLYLYHKPLSTSLKYNYSEIDPYFLKRDDEYFDFPIVVGQQKNGRYLVLELTDLPHIILQGVTGSGKSSAIRVILTTLIKYFKSEDLFIFCIDGKKSEFSLFKRVAHVRKVVHSNKHARDILRLACNEMSRREDLLDTFDVPNIKDLPKVHKPPFILIAIDELIEYIGDKNLMADMVKISSKGRSVGIFLLCSAQRMDADVIDTKARANFNIRMSLRTVDATNSRFVGTPGAEKIKGDEMGRLILNYGEIVELQSPHLDYKTAKRLLDPYCKMKPNTKPVGQEINDFKNDNINTLLIEEPNLKSMNKKPTDDYEDLFK